jgi:hypothetical protein
MCQPAGKHAHPPLEGALMAMDAAVDFAARISGATTDAATRVTGAIRDAAKVTGAGFEYLLNTAVRESNLDPAAKAKSSSATGLFQFIDQTWLGTMKQSGAALGYAKYASAITQTSSGRYTVADPAMRQEILALRKDPTANALMAGAFANANAKVLTGRGASERQGGGPVSARRAGQQRDLLRQAGRGEEPQAGLCRAGQPPRRDRRLALRRRHVRDRRKARDHDTAGRNACRADRYLPRSAVGHDGQDLELYPAGEHAACRRHHRHGGDCERDRRRRGAREYRHPVAKRDRRERVRQRRTGGAEIPVSLPERRERAGRSDGARIVGHTPCRGGRDRDRHHAGRRHGRVDHGRLESQCAARPVSVSAADRAALVLTR